MLSMNQTIKIALNAEKMKFIMDVVHVLAPVKIL
jgi:hypothetical protein